MSTATTILALDGVFDTGLAAFQDTLATARDLAPPALRESLNSSVSSIRRATHTAHGLAIPTVRADALPTPGFVFVPALGAKTEEGIADALAHPDVKRAVELLRTWQANGATIAAACSGRSYLRDPHKWMVLHQDALPAYIDWSHFERNQRQMAMNRSRHMGVPRGGAALLGGLISYGLCGRRMFTTYTDDGREARYVCHQLATTYGEARCQSISAWPVDRLTSTLILEALSPAAIEVSLQASEDIELERRQLHDQWKTRLERARYETALARRRYEAVDPDNRLVARTLERDWEAALAAEQSLTDEQRRALAQEPERLTQAERDAIRQLAQDIPALWSSASTTARDRQAIARMMLERVEVIVVGETERAGLVCHWVGGTVTKHAFTRPVRRFEQLENFDKLLARVIDLRSQGATAQIIADALNTEGWAPPKKDSFNAPMIHRLLQRRGLGTTRPIWSNNIPLRNNGEVTLQEYADRIGAHRQTVYGWLRRGRIKGRLAKVGTQRIWLVDLQNSSTGICTGESL